MLEFPNLVPGLLELDFSLVSVTAENNAHWWVPSTAVMCRLIRIAQVVWRLAQTAPECQPGETPCAHKGAIPSGAGAGGLISFLGDILFRRRSV